ncbi:MAG: hypothetical protein DRI86_07250 [Bacteroidetes bacterium]|nr:MAG: hypothetical protein DRI86_07250 [Bacteroidota bacterium]
MKLIKNSLAIIFLFISTFSFAQVGQVTFKETTHDFGKIKEELKKVSYDFEFTNTGKGDLKILKVKTSCGCTASQYTKTPIKPGKSGNIKVTYTTTNRPSTFRKSITVTVNNPDQPHTVLFIKGFVIPKEKGITGIYPTAIGNLKLVSNHLAFNKMLTSETRTDSMKIYNAWGHPMEISFEQIPPHLKVKCSTSKLDENESAYIIVTYDASKKNDYGLVYDRIAIRTNDNTQPMKILNVSARISQDFSGMSERELKKAPKISFLNTTYDFGTVKPGTVVKYSFDFTNEGKKTLNILKVKTSCGCTTTKLDVKTYKKGAAGKIDAIFNTRGRKGRQHKTITIITNDPKNPQITLTVKGELK